MDGNEATYEAHYDTTLDITWLADANANSTMPLDTANAWATNLNVNGVIGWRLPTMVDTGTSGCNSANTGTDCGYNVKIMSGVTVFSEMASLFYDTLGNLAFYDTNGTGPQSGWGLSNTGPFSNLQSFVYWTGLEYEPIPNDAWFFNFLNGFQGPTNKGFQNDTGTNNLFYALAVRPGDISAVPIPATFVHSLVAVFYWRCMIVCGR